MRCANPDDKRGQRVRLTANGLRLFDEIAPLHLANEERLLSSLTPGERGMLAQLLRKLLVSFESGTVQAGLPLGMRLEPAHLARYRRAAVGLSDTPGLLITDTIAGTPAAAAGLARGDLIVAVDAPNPAARTCLPTPSAERAPAGGCGCPCSAATTTTRPRSTCLRAADRAARLSACRRAWATVHVSRRRPSA